MNKKCSIFVTGATGLVGSYLLRYLLLQGYENIKALRRSSSKLDFLGADAQKVIWIEGEISDFFLLEDIMQGVDIVFHCAATVSYDERDYGLLMKTNVTGTENIVNTALYAGVKKLIYVSSIAAVGRDKNVPVINEKSKWVRNPLLTPYAISKYQSEQEVWRGAAEGLSVAIVNPAIILGSGDWTQSSTALFKQVWDGMKYYPQGATAFVDVRDVVRFMYQLMLSEISGERYILAGTNKTYQAFFTATAQKLRKTPPSRKVTPLLAAIAWRLEWLRSRLTGKRVLITKQTARISSMSYCFDNQKSLQAFDYQYTPFEDTIAAICQDMIDSAATDWSPRFLSF